VPLLDAHERGPARRFARRLRGRHPVAVFFAAILAGAAALCLIAVALGLLVTDVLLHASGVARTDEGAVRSLVAERTPFLTDASAVGSTLGGAPFLPILVATIALVCAVLHRWRVAAFAVFALAVESATYRVASLAGVRRHRSDVPRHAPPARRRRRGPDRARRRARARVRLPRAERRPPGTRPADDGGFPPTFPRRNERGSPWLRT
jgi:MFS family permease